MMRNIGEIRIQFLAATEGALGCRPIALIIQFHRRQQVVAFRPGVVQRETFAHPLLRQWPAFGWWQNTVGGAESMITGQAGVSRRVRRIERNGLLEIFAHALVARSKEVLPLVAPF